MERFSLIVACALVGCTTTPPSAADVVVAPVPKIYTCAQEQEIDGIFLTLPAVVQQVIGDYHAERVTLNRLQGKTGSPTCLK